MKGFPSISLEIREEEVKEEDLNVLITGGGGREHALYAAVDRSPRVTHTYVAPGNGGIPEEFRRDVDLSKLGDIIKLAKEFKIDLIVADRESLCAGLYNAAKSAGIAVFGPSLRAAKLERSKIYGMQICGLAGVAVPQWKPAVNEQGAHRIILGRQLGPLPVIKANGLKAGKGVTLPISSKEALETASKLLHENRNEPVLFQECLLGVEGSIFALCDGENEYLFPAARDYKRLGNYLGAPNTGGMGAHAPVPDINAQLLETIRKTIIRPVLDCMRGEDAPYHGILYVGLMFTESGPKVLEFNCGFGDPEAQVLLPLLESDIVEYMLASLTPGGLGSLPPLRFKDSVAVCVNLVSENYPGKPKIGRSVTGLDAAAMHAIVYHAGTKRTAEGYESSGGRVASFVGIAPTFPEARGKTYRAIKYAKLEGSGYRDDIAAGLT